MRIFLSYRREDASAWAGRLSDALSRRFGEGNIFQDVVAVSPGQDFTDAVNVALSRSDAVLAVIGPRWLTAVGDDGQPRISEENDYVRAELAAALAHAPLVIPVLVGGATVPVAARLPDDVRPLALLQAVTLRDESWQRDVDSFIRVLGGDRQRAQRRWWLIAAALAVTALAAGAITIVLRDRDAGNQASTSTPSPSTSFDPLSRLPECVTPTSSSGWTSLDVHGTTDVGSAGDPSASVEVVDGYYKMEQSGQGDVVLSAEYTNMTNAAQRQYWWFYKLTTDGHSFEPDCFSVTGGHDPAGPGETSEALVGFAITVDPTKGGALLVDDVGDRGRIELTPTSDGHTGSA
jgi:TIR domain